MSGLILELAWLIPVAGVLTRGLLGPGAVLAVAALGWASAGRHGRAAVAAAGALAVLAAAAAARTVLLAGGQPNDAALAALLALGICVRAAMARRAIRVAAQVATATILAAAALVAGRSLEALWPARLGPPELYAALAVMAAPLRLAGRAHEALDGAAAPAAGGPDRPRLAAALLLAGAAAALASLTAAALAGPALLRTLWQLRLELLWRLKPLVTRLALWLGGPIEALRRGILARWRQAGLAGEGPQLVGRPVPEPLVPAPAEAGGLEALMGALLLAAAAWLLYRLRAALRQPAPPAAAGERRAEAEPLDGEPVTLMRAARALLQRALSRGESERDPYVRRIRGLCRQLLWRWARRGWPRAAHATLREHFQLVARAGAVEAADAPALAAFRAIYEAARYGRQAGPEEAARARALFARLVGESPGPPPGGGGGR